MNRHTGSAVYISIVNEWLRLTSPFDPDRIPNNLSDPSRPHYHPNTPRNVMNTWLYQLLPACLSFLSKWCVQQPSILFVYNIQYQDLFYCVLALCYM